MVTFDHLTNFVPTFFYRISLTLFYLVFRRNINILNRKNLTENYENTALNLKLKVHFVNKLELELFPILQKVKITFVYTVF